MDEYSYELQQKATRKRHQGLSRFKLKVIADVLLFISVASTTIVPHLVGEPTANNMTALTVAVLCQVAGWAAIPLFAWFLYTGYVNTHNALAYGIRLAALAVICEAPYDLVNYGTPWDMRSQNPVFALVIALVVLALLQALRRYTRSVQIVLTILVVLVALVWIMLLRIGQDQSLLNIGVLTLAMVLVFYWLHDRENTMMLTAGLLGAMYMIVPAVGVVILHYRNDKVGAKHAWTQWAFYAIYPIVLLVCLAAK